MADQDSLSHPKDSAYRCLRYAITNITAPLSLLQRRSETLCPYCNPCCAATPPPELPLPPPKLINSAPALV
ncbi:putative homeobox protein VENTX-like isoform X4 [Sesbania bispinosa]|nr:putative homeobox protein VENTX-like isoform X4 [Sesbania bispinosa]